MTSAAIVTLVGNSNYGNRLQNFALQESLLNLGVDRVETIRSSQQKNDLAGSFYRRARATLDTRHPRELAARLHKRFSLNHAATKTSVSVNEFPRRAKIDGFTQSLIRETSRDYLPSDFDDDFAGSFDYFVVGSDQVWAPAAGLSNRLRFLEFALPQQRVAYAASFGLSSLPSHCLTPYPPAISEIAHLSVREDRAAEIVWELTGREAQVVLDPTMLLEPAKWEELAIVPTTLQGREYVAEFFLDSASEAELLPVTQHATARGLDRANLSWNLSNSYSSDPSESGLLEDLAAMGPLEFIGAIKASNLLVTDSFHAAVFATIFRVPYLLKARGDMNSRFDTLLSKSGLTVPKWGTLKELEASIDIDWDSVHHNIARERAESLDYLQTALSLPTGT